MDSPELGLGRLDHVGIAVRTLADGLALYRDLLGFTHIATHDAPESGVRVAVLELPNTRLELLEPLGEDSPVARFIKQRGPGVHHLAFWVDDIARAQTAARARGLRLLDEVPRVGKSGRQIVYLHPFMTRGTILEMCAYPA